MIMEKKHVFIINTVYQGLICAYLINDLDPYDSVYVLDATTCGDFLEAKCFSDRTIVFKLFENRIDQSSFIKQLASMKRIFNSHSFVFKNVYALYVFNDPSPVEAYICKKIKGSGSRVFFLEEGLSAYRKISSFTKEGFFGFVKSALAAFFMLSYKINFGHSKYFDVLYLRNPNKFNELFPKNNKKIKKLDFKFNNNSINDAFLGCFFYEDNWLYNADLRVVFYFGQPLSETGLIEENFELEVLKKINRICLDKKILFCIKTHPKENFTKYSGFDHVLNSIVPVELILSKMNRSNTVIVSPFSSANSNLVEFGFLNNLYVFKLFGIQIDFESHGVLVVDSFFSLEKEIACLSEK